MEQSSWELELKQALSEDASHEQIKSLLKGRCLPVSLRADVWSHCLGPTSRKFNKKFRKNYKHPNWSEIRTGAWNIVKDLPSKYLLRADAEAILTVHFKSGSKPLRYDDSVLSVLRPIIDLNLTRNERFSVFQTVLDKFIPRE